MVCKPRHSYVTKFMANIDSKLNNNSAISRWPGKKLGPIGPVLSGGYFISCLARKLAYSLGVMKTGRLSVPVISVGNMTVGGSGKTVCVEMLSRMCMEMGASPAVISRGYGSFRTKNGDIVQDEAMLLGQNLPSVPVYMDANRIRAGRKAVLNGADCIILDDAFSHLKIVRDLDIVLVDATMPLKDLNLLPYGPLREPKRWIKRAGVIIFTRVDQVTTESLKAQMAYIRAFAPNAIWAHGSHAPHALTRVYDSNSFDINKLDGQKVFAVSGIGNPKAFEKTITDAGAIILEQMIFGDHHKFEQADLTKIINNAEEVKADILLCTQKDAVKLKLLDIKCENLYSLDVKMQLSAGEKEIKGVLSRLLGL